MSGKSPLATRNAAQKELILLERIFRPQSSLALERNNTPDKNAAPEASYAANAEQNDEAKSLATYLTKPKHEERSNVKLRGAPTMKPEQRAYLDEIRNSEMPRQGVSLLNAMLGFFFFAYLFSFFS